MTTKIVRLLLMLGVLAFLVASKEEQTFAASWCCGDCAGTENTFANDCPGGTGQSDYCAHLAWWANNCWQACTEALCSPPHPQVCHLVQDEGYSWYLCH